MQHSLKHRQRKALQAPPTCTSQLTVPLSHIPGFDALPRSALSTPELIDGGIGIHFSAIDDVLSVENLRHPERAMWSAMPPRIVPQASPRHNHRREAGH